MIFVFPKGGIFFFAKRVLSELPNWPIKQENDHIAKRNIEGELKGGNVTRTENTES